MSRSAKIVVIDDQVAVLESIAEYLTDMDYCVLTADGGAKGVQMIKEESPDLVLTDLIMPEVDGHQVLESASEVNPEMPVIVISGTGVISDSVKALKLGAWDYLLKPIQDMQVIGHAVEKALERARLLHENKVYHQHLEELVERRTQELTSANNELKGSIEQIRHINKELEIAKAKAEESNRLKSTFLANLSHEIRTPMNGILGFSELLRDQGLSTQLREQYIKQINYSGRRMLNLINDLVEISKIETRQLEVHYSRCNLAQLLEDVRLAFFYEAQEKGISLIVKNTKKESCVMFSDSSKIEKIFEKLVSNALKFTKEGVVEMGIEMKSVGVSCYVKDTGVGIPSDKRSVIWDYFRQVEDSPLREQEGAGLGLSIVKAFVDVLGGSIAVESEIGKGTVFSFFIPDAKL